MGASIVMMSSDLELPDSVYGIIDDCGFTYYIGRDKAE